MGETSRKSDGRMEMSLMGISLLPGGGPGQQLEARLRVPGEDDVSW